MTKKYKLKSDDRTNKTVSFSHKDAYEEELLKYAMSTSHGKFGPYVKRLIDRDRAGAFAASAVPIVRDAQIVPSPKPAPIPKPAPAPVPAPVSAPTASVNKTIAKSFL